MMPRLATLTCSPPTGWPPTDGDIPLPPAPAAMLDAIERLHPHRVLVLGEAPLEILCALIRRGCEAAAELLPGERPEPHSADMVTATLPRARANLDHLLSQARRALLPGGWLLVQVAGAAREARAQHAAWMLRQAGFTQVSVVSQPDTTILRARVGEHAVMEAVHA